MSWADAQEAVRTAVIAASGFADRAGLLADTTIREVDWVRRGLAPARWTSTGRVDLRLKDVQHIGDAETRREYDAENDGLIVHEGSLIDFEVSVTVTARSQEPGAEGVGWLSGRIRTGIGSPRVLDILRLGGVALRDVGRTQEMDVRDVNGAWQSVGITSYLFGTTDVWTDTELEAYILTVNGTLNLTGGVREHSYPFSATTP